LNHLLYALVRACVRACACTYRKMVHKYYMFQVNDKCIVKLYVIIKNIFFVKLIVSRKIKIASLFFLSLERYFSARANNYLARGMGTAWQPSRAAHTASHAITRRAGYAVSTPRGSSVELTTGIHLPVEGWADAYWAIFKN